MNSCCRHGRMEDCCSRHREVFKLAYEQERLAYLVHHELPADVQTATDAVGAIVNKMVSRAASMLDCDEGGGESPSEP